MATITKNTNKTWQELSATSCIFQKKSSGDVYIKYADSLPTLGFTDAYLVTSSAIMNLPAPISGRIYVASPKDETVLVTDI